MSINRKVILLILYIVLIALTTYFNYTNLYVENIEIIKQINRYKTLIKNINKQNLPIENNYNITDLKIIEKKTFDNFFSKTEALSSVTTPYIKTLLSNNNMTIKQYQENINSVSFFINGKISDLISFFYTLYKEDKYYDTPLLNIKMINNQDFIGVLEISRVVFQEQTETDDITFILKQPQNKKMFDSNTESIFGTSFKEMIKEQQVEVKKIVNLKTEKFDYVGIMKKGNNTITIFKDRINGRVYRYKVGTTISGWTYLGHEKNIYRFSKDRVIYEVEE